MNLSPVKSSNVTAVGVDGEDLIVQYKNSAVNYRYVGAGPRHADMLKAESVGRFLNQHIKPAYLVQRVEREDE